MTFFKQTDQQIVLIQSVTHNEQNLQSTIKPATEINMLLATAAISITSPNRQLDFCNFVHLRCNSDFRNDQTMLL